MFEGGGKDAEEMKFIVLLLLSGLSFTATANELKIQLQCKGHYYNFPKKIIEMPATALLSLDEKNITVTNIIFFGSSVDGISYDVTKKTDKVISFRHPTESRIYGILERYTGELDMYQMQSETMPLQMFKGVCETAKRRF